MTSDADVGSYPMTFSAVDEEGLRTDCNVIVRVLIGTILIADPIVAEVDERGARPTFGPFRATLTERPPAFL
jgi:hypothetical protein